MKRIKILFLCVLFSTSMLINCYDSQVPSDKNHTYNISECKSEAVNDNVEEPEKEPVLNEELIWIYDAQNKNLNIIHTNIVFNCEMNFLVEINYNNDTKIYEIIEENVSTLRARCLCFYDGTYTINNVETGTITIKLSEEFDGFESVLDLSANSGIVSIKKDVTLY